MEYNTRYNYNTNTVLLVDCIDFNLNNNYKALVETNTLPLETITDTLSDIAVRYQLSREYQYTGDITTSTYNQITNNKTIFIVDGNAVYDNFIDSPNTIKKSVTINDKTTNRTFTLSHKDYEDILRQNLPHNQLIEQLQNMTYQYTGAIETYTITNKITTTDDIEEALNTNYTTSIQNTYLASLFVTYFFDSIANEYKNYYNVTYNRTSTITTACYVNASKIIIHSFNPEMGMQIQGETINKWIYKFTTTSMLNVIEADVINILRNKTGPDKTKSTLEIIFANLAENKDNLITGHRGNNYFIIDSLNNVFISVDLSTGLVNDGSVIDDDLFHASNRECEACLFLKEINENDANWTNNVYGTSLIGGLLLDELHTPEITRYRYMCLYQMTDMFLNRIDKYNLRQFIGPGVIVSILVKQGYNVEYLAQIINYIDEPCEIILSSGMTFAESTVVTFIEACIIGRICHWHTLEDQDKYSPENMKVDEIEKYDYWDGYASISMNYYDYSSVELVKHDFRMENERIMRIKLTTWGKLDKSDIVIVDNTGMHNPTPDEVEYIKDYDNVWDFLWGLPIRNPA